MPTIESKQKWIGRNRPPRVHITYDVETGGAIEKTEIPFVVGVLANLSGDQKKPKKLGERKFVEIDRDNFSDIMKTIAPRLELKRVERTLPPKDGTPVEAPKEPTEEKTAKTPEDDAAPAKTPTLSVTLDYNEMETVLKEKYGSYKESLQDGALAFFEPVNVVRAVDELRALYDTRRQLSDLLAKLDGNEDLDDLLKQVVYNTEELTNLQQQVDDPSKSEDGPSDNTGTGGDEPAPPKT